MRTRELLALLAACATVGACDTRVNVDAAANVSAQFSSVLVTVKEVWLNENATAAPEDGGWLKFPLAQPRTLELVEIDDAAVTELASELKVEPGTYHQIRLLLVDRGEPLTESARTAGAAFNDQVTYFDANRVKTTVPLELANAARGIGDRDGARGADTDGYRDRRARGRFGAVEYELELDRGDADPDDDLRNDATAHDDHEPVRAGHALDGHDRADCRADRRPADRAERRHADDAGRAARQLAARLVDDRILR